jgi:hypothetical protein
MAGKFEPKTPVQLDPPKDDPISLEELAKASGTTTHLAQRGMRKPSVSPPEF